MSVVPNAWELRGAPEDRDWHAAEARGRERGAELLHCLRSEAEAQQVTPLEAFRFAFHEGPDALHAAAKAEAEAAASMHAHARRDIGDVGGNGSSAPESTVAAAATQRRVADALKSDPGVVEVQWLEKAESRSHGHRAPLVHGATRQLN